MSFLKKILGRDVDNLVEEAREKEKEGDIGGALIDYERALDGIGEREDERRAELAARVRDLRDALAQRYVEQAHGYLAEREIEKAAEALGMGLEVAGSDGKKQELRKKQDAVHLMLAESEVGEEETEMGEEEVYQALSGAWTQEQIDEFDGYGEKFKKAYLGFHDGSFEEAVAAYRALLEEAGEDALYLRLELARALYLGAQARAEKEGGAGEAERMRDEAAGLADEFRKMLPRRRTPQVRAQAWSLLAQIHLDRNDPESAEDALMEAQNVIPGEPYVYVNLGRFLFDRGRRDDAIAALEQGEEIMDKLHPNVDLLQLLGTAHREAGNTREAVKRFEEIISYSTALGRESFDPAVARPLAEMYEEIGSIQEAADAYRNLSTSGEPGRLAEYNYHAARLMKKLGKKMVEIRPYVLRAREHASDEGLRKKIEELERGL